DIAHSDSRSQWHTEGLNCTIKILVIERVFIVPNPTDRARHLITDEGTSIDSGVRFNHVDCCAGPSADGSGRSDRVSDSGKVETGRATDAKLPVRRIVIHVALSGVRLAPGVFMRGDILRFGKIGCARIL